MIKMVMGQEKSFAVATFNPPNLLNQNIS